MIAPTVHMNGTSGDDLLAQLESAYTAVQAAIAAVMAAAPNGRDYYVKGDAAWKAARATHDRHVRALIEVRDELVQAGERVQDQIAERERMRSAGKRG